MGNRLADPLRPDPEVTVLDTIGGIPLHPLIVHAVVVLVPLASLLLLLAAVSPRIRHWAGILTPITATLALVMVPLATQSGEALEKRVDASPALEEHTELGDSLLYFVLTLAILAWALWFLDRRARATVTTTDAAQRRRPRHPPCRSFGAADRRHRALGGLRARDDGPGHPDRPQRRLRLVVRRRREARARRGWRRRLTSRRDTVTRPVARLSPGGGSLPRPRARGPGRA